MKYVITFLMLLLLTGCTRGIINNHESYYIEDDEPEVECNCDTSCEDTMNKIESKAQDIVINPDDYSKNDMYKTIEEIYYLAK